MVTTRARERVDSLGCDRRERDEVFRRVGGCCTREVGRQASSLAREGTAWCALGWDDETDVVTWVESLRVSVDDPKTCLAGWVGQ